MDTDKYVVQLTLDFHFEVELHSESMEDAIDEAVDSVSELIDNTRIMNPERFGHIYRNLSMKSTQIGSVRRNDEDEDLNEDNY